MPILERLLSFIAPHECIVCEIEGTLLCETCSAMELEVIPERCYRCLKLSRDSAVCQSCKRTSPLRYVWVATEYNGIAKKLIHAFKFERGRDAYKPIAGLISDSLPYIKPSTIVTHVPTATARHRLRGYDQAELIAREVAKRTGATYLSLLERSGQHRQVGSSRQVRITQLQSSFRVKQPDNMSTNEILLIDDIVTTGASLEAAAKTLKAAGAKRVDAAVFAQKH